MEVEAVLDFLRKNGFTEAESALREDILEKGPLGSYEFEKFLFPMLPPLSIPETSRKPDADDTNDGDKSSTASSNDDFVSLESFPTDVNYSEFANPYPTTSSEEASSDDSSDRMSQFGTARAYHDFGPQNDLYWYNDLDEGIFLTPSFRASDPFGCPSEDKFIMSSELNKQYFVNPMGMYDNQEESQSETGIEYNDKPCSFRVNSLNDANGVQEAEYYDLKIDGQASECYQGELEGCIDYDCSKPLCKSGTDEGRFCVQDPVDDECLIDLTDIQLNAVRKEQDDFEFIINQSSDYSMHKSPMNGRVEGFKGLAELGKSVEFSFPNGDCEAEHEETANGDLHDDDTQVITDGEGIHEDEQLLSGMREDEYEVFNLRIVQRKSRTGFEENKDFPIVLNTIIAGRYYVTEYLGSAAFSKVVQAHDLVTGMDVCLKIIKNDKDFFDQSLDEIKLLKLVNKYDPADECHILRLYDYFYHKEHLFIVCELLRANLYEFQKFNQESGGEAYFTLSRLQVITGQVLEALEYLHGLGIIHCDLKPENILIKSYRRCEIKVIDLGSSCFETDNLSLYVQSRSYRAPEVILGLPYDKKIDLWSFGCVLAELYSGEVLFPNEAIPMILARITGIVGPIDMEMLENGQEVHKYFTKEYDLYHMNEETKQLEFIIPESSSLEQHLQVTDPEFIDFLKCLLQINPKERPTASEALRHPWLAHSY